MKKLLLALALIFTNLAVADCTKHEHPPILDLDHYYQPAAGLAGHELRRALNTIISGHTRYRYTPCVWDMLKEADQDAGNPENVIGIYTGRSFLKTDQDDGQNNPDSWNREHIWAKSHGFPKATQHAYTDVHHIRVVDRSVNTDRSDNDFGDGGTPDEECNGCLEGHGTWEPPDRVKGDIARMLFYMDVRYEGNDATGTQDLRLVDEATTERSDTVGRFGKLCTLVQWHVDDPVSADEIRRNGVVQSWQGNRNPFIDRPEFAERLWGRECDVVDKGVATQ